MQNKIKKIIYLSCLCTIATAFQADNAIAASARSSSVTDWGNCGGGSRSWWDDMCMRWRKTMGTKGWRQWASNYGNVTIERYVDPDMAPWGNDKFNWDGGDAALICTHGSTNANTGWAGRMHHQSNGECDLDSNQMKIGKFNGNGNTRFMHLSSCNSGRYEHRLNWFTAAQGRVHVIMGFHGLMYIGSSYVDEYGYLANNGFGKGVGKVWMDEMYHEDHWYNGWKNLCPMSFGFGNSRANARYAHNEKYNDNWRDQTPRWMNTRYYKGCDPDGAQALPN